VQIDATRRARGATLRTKSSTAGWAGAASGSPTPATIQVSTVARVLALRVSTARPSEDCTGPPATENASMP